MAETGGRRALRESHAEHCRAAGMTEEEAARDWAEFEADYDVWLGDLRAREDAEDPRFADAGRDEAPEDGE